MLHVLLTEIIHPVLAEKLTAAGFHCRHLPQATYNEVARLLHDYDGLVVRSKIKVDKVLIDLAPRLQFIGRVGSGMELIDTSYAQQRGITCLNSPEGNCDAVGEQALGMLLCLLRNIIPADAAYRQMQWQRQAGEELNGKTVGIIGFGNTGRSFARRLSGFDVQLLAYDKYKTNFGNDQVREVSLTQLLELADVISLHVPLTSETRYMVNADFIAQCGRKPIYLINTSRGEVVHTAQVVESLQQGNIKGLALDVFENEEFSTFTEADKHWFLQLIAQHNVVLTPHTGGITHQSAYKIADILAQKIIAQYARNPS